MKKTYKFHVNGMHCKACAMLTNDALNNVQEIERVKSSFATHSVLITGEFGDKTPEHIAQELSEILRPRGYTLSPEKHKHATRWSDFYFALPISAVFIAFFIALQAFGIIDLFNISKMGYGAAFIIGIVASVSSCMAIVGGLLLSMPATLASGHQQIRTHILFHTGRIIAFFLFGGLIGIIGSMFQFSLMSAFIVNILIALVLLILGINLLDIWPRTSALQFVLPSFIGERVRKLKNVNHILMPFIVGVATFFLPCGFTQSIQFYALTTGSFLEGSLILGIFALGTLPALALVSFGSLHMHKKAQSGVFFKIAGLIVIFFGLFTILSALISIGALPPLLNF